MKTFRNSVAVVTGASSGIGQAIAANLWKQGATVCLVARNRAQLETAIADDGEGRERIHCCPMDVTRDEDARGLAANLAKRFERIDALVHCAGAFVREDWESLAVEELDRLYRTNLRAPVVLTQAFLPALRASKGQVVFMNSSAGRTAGARTGAYSATKHALRAFADSLRNELNPLGVRVISVYPGRTATAMQRLVCTLEGTEYRPEFLLSPEDVASTVVHAMALPESAEVTDLYIRPMTKAN
jgi:NADP-dependent 3-hydroxy acid dehydrogenase YdfG